MWMPHNVPIRVLSCLLIVTIAGCRPLSPRADPLPDTASLRTGTASNTALQRDEANQQTYSRIEELIESRASGVQVIRLSDGGFALRIRGLSSPTGGNNPLIVIDGTQILEGSGNSALGALNPQDVVRIDVLKDAASTAFYGMRGANGVIVVTTRRH